MPGAGPRDPALRAARELLGVAADADATQLTRAYWRQARRLHPDTSVEPDATERFWALQAAYRLALDAAPVAARPDASTVEAPTEAPAETPAETPTPVEHRDPTVVLGTALHEGLVTSRSSGPGYDEWLVAGPVQVQPPRRRDAAPTSRGEP